MPFVCGVHDSMLDEVLQQPIEDAMIFAKLDTGEIMTAGEEQGNLPQAQVRSWRRPHKAHTELTKGRMLQMILTLQ